MPQHWAAAARRPRAADRHRCALSRMARSSLLPGFDEGAWWVQDAAAALPARLLGDVARQARRRSLRRARRQDRAARARRRAGHRGRPLGAAPRAAARESRAARACGRNRRRRRHANGRPGRSTPCCSTRPARRPAPSAAIPTSPGSRREADLAKLAALQTRLLDHAATLLQAGRHARLLHLLAGARGGRAARSPRCWRASPTCAGGRSRPTRSAALPSCSTPTGDLRTLPCHLPDAEPRMAGLDGFYAARTRRQLEGLTRPRRLAAVPTLRYMLPRGRRAPWRPRQRRGERVHGGRCRSRSAPGCPCSWCAAGCAVAAGRVRGHPLIRWRFLPAQDRPPGDRAAGPAHRRPDPRERNLCRPLRLRRQGRDLRRPLAVRDDAAVGGMGGGAARLRLAAPSARRRIRHHPRQCARAGRRMDRAAGLAGIAIAWRPDIVARRDHRPGSARRR